MSKFNLAMSSTWRTCSTVTIFLQNLTSTVYIWKIFWVCSIRMTFHNQSLCCPDWKTRGSWAKHKNYNRYWSGHKTRQRWAYGLWPPTTSTRNATPRILWKKAIGGQPTQVHSLIQATLDGAIKETVSAATQIPVRTFTYSGTSPAVSTASTGDGS